MDNHLGLLGILKVGLKKLYLSLLSNNALRRVTLRTEAFRLNFLAKHEKNFV